MHGSAEAVGGRASAVKQGRAVATANLASVSFTVDTGSKTEKPERTIRRDATRAKAVGQISTASPALASKGAELHALAVMPASERQSISGRAADRQTAASFTAPPSQSLALSCCRNAIDCQMPIGGAGGGFSGATN